MSPAKNPQSLNICACPELDSSLAHSFSQTTWTAFLKIKPVLFLYFSPDLTWRDVHHLVTLSSNSCLDFDPASFFTNAAGYRGKYKLVLRIV